MVKSYTSKKQSESLIFLEDLCICVSMTCECVSSSMFGNVVIMSDTW